MTDGTLTRNECEVLGRLVLLAANRDAGRDPHYLHIEPPHRRDSPREPDDLWRVVLRPLERHAAHRVYVSSDLGTALTAAERDFAPVTYTDEQAHDLRQYLRQLMGQPEPGTEVAIVRMPAGIELRWTDVRGARGTRAPGLAYDEHGKLHLLAQPAQIEPTAIWETPGGHTTRTFIGAVGPITIWTL